MGKSDVRLLQFIMDQSNLHCLVNGFTKRMLSRSNTHQTYLQLNLRCLYCGAIKLTLFIYPFSYLSWFFFLSLFGPN